VQDFEAQLAAADEPELEKLQARAELLTTYAYGWKEGNTELLCYDMETGQWAEVTPSAGPCVRVVQGLVTWFVELTRVCVMCRQALYAATAGGVVGG
jgi:hypothetical protein